MSAETTFQQVKEEICALIQTKPQVTASTPRGVSGIYLLYVDDFSDDKVLPIYIGQTTDFKARLRQHVSDVSKLNDVPYHEYYNRFFWGAKQYDGHFKSCKIFKYMVEHQCLLKDLRMIILEECGKDALHEREQFYLSKYLPAFLGFNQINSITEQWELRTKPREYVERQKTDADLFAEYIGFGFTKFNYLHAFWGTTYNVKHNTKRDYLDKVTDRAHYWNSETRAENITRLSTIFRAYTDVFEQKKEMMSATFAPLIHEIFEQCKLKSNRREEEVISLLLNNCDEKEATNVIEIKEYLEYYMDRNRNSKKCGELLRALFAERLDEIRKINAPVKKAYTEYLNFRKEIFSHSRLSLIFPEVAYPNYPLDEETEE